MARRKRRTYPDLSAFFDDAGAPSQAVFAARIGKSQSYISKVRNGAIEPNLTDALVIAKEAGIPLESLIKRPVELSRS